MYREIAERFLSILVNRAFIFWALTVRNQSLLEVRSSFFSLANRVLYLKKKFKRKFTLSMRNYVDKIDHVFLVFF